MSQCVPICHTDTNDTCTTPRSSNRSTAAADTHMLEYEVAELTWENGQVSLHGLGPPRMPSKYSSGGGTLESIVDQATRLPIPPDALVPSSPAGLKRPRLVPDQFSMSGSETVGRDQSRRLTIDTFDTGFTSPENTSTKTTTIDDHDSVCHSRPQREEVGGKSSVSTKRSRAAAIHNQSERKRRDKINQRMKTLQKMVPNSSKTDKASMLDEVIEYLKQLQGQVSMMSRMNMPSSVMLPTMQQQQQQQQQQLHFSLMSNPMGLGLGLGMGMPGIGLVDLTSMNRPAGNMIPMTNPFMPPSASNDTRYHSPQIIPPDPMAAFLACSSQPSTMEAYSRMVALYQQMHQQLPPPPNPK